jgi:hypothetical protein
VGRWSGECCFGVFDEGWEFVYVFNGYWMMICSNFYRLINYQLFRVRNVDYSSKT